MTRRRSEEAFATLCTSLGEGYLEGVLVLHRSLLDVGSDRDFVVLLDRASAAEHKALLERYGCRVEVVAPVIGRGVTRAEALCPWFKGVFDKLRLWQLSDYRKVAYLDADALVLKNLDHLFAEPGLVAAPDASRTDNFNSGFFIAEPSPETSRRLLAMAEEHESWDGGDQSLLNAAFRWYDQGSPPRLRVAYNHQADRIPVAEPARRRVAVAHFYGVSKPWQVARRESEPEPEATTVPLLHRSGFEERFERGLAPLLRTWRRFADLGEQPSAGPPRGRRRTRTAFATTLIHGSQLAPALALKASLEATTPGHEVVALLAPHLHGPIATSLERRGFSVVRTPWVLPPGRVSMPTAASLVRLRLWQMTDYARVVHLAPTVVALQDVSDLAERPPIAAPPRSQRPDLLQSDVLVLEPSGETFRALVDHAVRSGAATFERCLNGFFADWFERSAEHRLAQLDGFEIESFFCLAHTELLPRLLEQRLLRLVNFAPFVFARRWILTPSLEGGEGRAAEAFRSTDGRSPGLCPTESGDLVSAEVWLDQEPCDQLWARELWRSKWLACKRELGIEGTP